MPAFEFDSALLIRGPIVPCDESRIACPQIRSTDTMHFNPLMREAGEISPVFSPGSPGTKRSLRHLHIAVTGVPVFLISPHYATSPSRHYRASPDENGRRAHRFSGEPCLQPAWRSSVIGCHQAAHGLVKIRCWSCAILLLKWRLWLRVLGTFYSPPRCRKTRRSCSSRPE